MRRGDTGERQAQPDVIGEHVDQRGSALQQACGIGRSHRGRCRGHRYCNGPGCCQPGLAGDGIGEIIRPDVAVGRVVKQLASLDHRSAMRHRADSGQGQSGTGIVGENVDDNSVAFDHRRIREGRGGRDDDLRHGNGDAGGRGLAVDVGLGVAERIRAEIAGRRGIEDLAALDHRRAVLRRGDTGKRQPQSGVVGEHVDQRGSALQQACGIDGRHRGRCRCHRNGHASGGGQSVGVGFHVAEAVAADVAVCRGIEDLAVLNRRRAVLRRTNRGQHQPGTDIIGEHVDNDAIAFDDRGSVSHRRGWHGNPQDCDRDLGRRCHAVAIGFGVVERVRTSEAGGRGVEHLAVLDHGGAVLRLCHPGQIQPGAAIIGEHIDQHRGALVHRRGVADGDRSGDGAAADIADRDEGGVIAEGREVEVERQVLRPWHLAQIDGDDVRAFSQVQLAVDIEPGDGDAWREEHRAISLHIQQILGLRQPERAEHRLPGGGIAQRDLEGVRCGAIVLEQLPVEDGERQRCFRWRQRESLLQRG